MGQTCLCLSIVTRERVNRPVSKRWISSCLSEAIHSAYRHFGMEHKILRHAKPSFNIRRGSLLGQNSQRTSPRNLPCGYLIGHVYLVLPNSTGWTLLTVIWFCCSWNGCMCQIRSKSTLKHHFSFLSWPFAGSRGGGSGFTLPHVGATGFSNGVLEDGVLVALLLFEVKKNTKHMLVASMHLHCVSTMFSTLVPSLELHLWSRRAVAGAPVGGRVGVLTISLGFLSKFFPVRIWSKILLVIHPFLTMGKALAVHPVSGTLIEQERHTLYLLSPGLFFSWVRKQFASDGWNPLSLKCCLGFSIRIMVWYWFRWWIW